MNIIIITKTTLALAALTTATVSFAQQPAMAPTGLLGQRYAEASFGVTDLSGISKNAYDVDFGVNLPVASSLDLRFDYDYGWTKAFGRSVHANSIGAGAVAYTNLSGVKSFVQGGVGRTWVGGAGRGNFNTWVVGIGAELPVGDFTVTPSIRYSDLLNNQSGGEYHYGIEGSTWVTKTLAGFASVTFSDGVGRGGESWTYLVGIRSKF